MNFWHSICTVYQFLNRWPFVFLSVTPRLGVFLLFLSTFLCLVASSFHLLSIWLRQALSRVLAKKYDVDILFSGILPY